MLDAHEIDRIAKDAATSVLGAGTVSRVVSEPRADMWGNDGMRVTVVLVTGKEREVTGEQALGTLVAVTDAIRDSGDDRYALVEFITEAELSADAESEL